MSAAPHDHGLVAIQVPADVADAVNAWVDSGEYANQGDVVRNGLHLLSEEDKVLHSSEVDHWLRTVVVPIAEATLVDPSRSIPADEVRAHFAARRTGRA